VFEIVIIVNILATMSSSKPVYIPKRRKITQQNDNTNNSSSSTNTGGNYKKAKQDRFHGAFTGGFSAGHFNTVGSKEGWVPSQYKKKEQRIEDFMDDEDREGPTKLREDYGMKAPTNKSIVDDGTTSITGDSSQKRENQQSTFLPLKLVLEVSHETVGPRLLRRLGWRKEGGMAIVPENTTTKLSIGTTRLVGKNGEENDDDILKNLTRIHLSRRKLRQIRLQTSRIKLPPPKLDQCGLGFEPYENAPEFQKYREKRKQQARDRASYNTNNNIYRISDVASGIDGKGGPISHSHQPDKSSNEQSEYLSYETAEDFVGKRSTGGFALRDDEDDAYDDDHNTNNQPKDGSQLNSSFKPGEEYNTEVYEHESSDDDGNDVNTTITNSRLSTIGGDKHSQPSKPVDVGDMFAAWAGNDKSSNALSNSSSNSKPTVLTDGKPPLSGFVLGDSMNTNKRRYPGPDIPREYTIQRHKFGENENPYVFEAISNAMKLERKEERTKSQMGQQQQQQQESQRQRQRQLKLHDEENRPLSNNFSSLGEAMKLRFTKESTDEQKDDVPGGLCMPNPVEKKDDFKESNNDEKPQITISRTVKTFVPNTLVCKRFHVPLPRNSGKNAGLVAVDDKRDTESAYFEREILKKATQRCNQNKQLPVQNEDAPENEDYSEEVHKGIDRPSIEKLKSIFEPSSDESSSEDESIEDDDNTDKETSKLKAIVNDSKETETNNSLIQNIHKSSDVSQELVEYQPPSSKEGDDNVSSCSSTDESTKAASSRKRKKEKHRKRHHRKRRSRKRSHSANQDSDRSSANEEEEEEEEKERRRERRRKHKKKKKKSSHSRDKTRTKEI
jgi:hypothetical protein